jgi:hypothetical protein
MDVDQARCRAGSKCRNVCDPVAQRFVDCVFQSARAGVDFADLGPKKLHTKNIELLAAHVFRAHVDDAIESKKGADSSGSDTVLARTCFGHYALLVHAAGEQYLADRVVYFVRASVEEVFAFEIDLRAAAVICQSLGTK